MNHAALKAQLEARAKELIAKRDGKKVDVEVDEDDVVFGSDTHEDDHPNPKGMGLSALKAALAKNAERVKASMHEEAKRTGKALKEHKSKLKGGLNTTLYESLRK